MHCVIVTNIPSPYRNPVYELLPPGEFTVLFCARSEGNRQWQLAPLQFAHRVLPGKARALADGYNFVHDNPAVWRALNELRPDVVITTGVNPTHLRAFAWTRLNRARHVYQTDGTVQSEEHLGWKHRAVRRIVLQGSAAGIAASSSGCALLSSYGLAPDRIFKSPLCADNARFSSPELAARDFDVMFVGQLHERKLPMLFVQTCAALRQQRGSCSALVLGDGPMRTKVLDALVQARVDVHYAVFVQPEALPPWYGRSKLLLFTTRLDPWGVVANEAMAAGTPVLTTAFAGAAGDLVVDQVNGRILPVDVTAWVAACRPLLDDALAWQRMSTQALARVGDFSYAAAARGIVDACARADRDR